MNGFFLTLCVVSLVFVSCSDNNVENIENGVDTNFIQIGDQKWMKYNLNSDTLIDGTIIKEAKTDIEWNDAWNQRMPAWCYVNNDSSNKNLYGKIYNGYAISKLKTPIGYRISTESDWAQLFIYLGGDSLAGIKLVNEQFKAVLCGVRYGNGRFNDINKSGYWWSPIKSDSINANSPIKYIRINNNSVKVQISQTSPGDGLTVRCIKN